MAARLAVGAWQASRLIRKSLTAPPTLVDELRAIVGEGARLPRLRLNARLVTPVATGALRPTIVLPAHFAENSPCGELRAVLGHEWAHICNGDLWLLALDRCLFPLLSAHPVYWWLRRRIRQDQEFLADAAAASLIGPADYAAQLVAWARDLAGVRRIVVSNAVGIWERPSGFALRISTILNQADAITLHCSGRVRAAVVAVLAVLSLIAASVSVRPPNVESAPTRTDARPAATEPPKTAELRPGPDDLGGTCLDREEKPISGVQVDLYQVGVGDGQRFMERMTTNDAGQFVFRHVSLPRKPGEGYYTLVFRSKGLATELRAVWRRRDCDEIKLGKAATLKGVVKNQQGQPVTGALVFPWFDQFCLQKPIPGIRCSMTDARGVFVIDDLAEFKFVEPNVPVEMRIATHLNPPGLVIQHPDYEGTPIPYTQVPDRMDIELAKGAVITGLVVDGESGRPAPGLTLALQGIDKQSRKANSYWTTAQTDQGGRYRLTSLPAGKFNVYLRKNPPGLTFAALDSFEVRQSQTVEAPPIRLIKGGLIKGRLIDDATGQPAMLTGDETASIGAHGPSRPRSGASIQGTDVKKDGTFEMRLPPGTNWIYVSGTGPFGVVGDVRPGFGHVVREIKVVEGAEYDLEFRVTKGLPPKSSNDKRTQTESRAVARHLETRTAGATAEQKARTDVGRFIGLVRLAGKTPGTRIADVFVYLPQAPSGTAAAVPQQPFLLRTDGAAFSPRAGIARVGQTLTLRNDGRMPGNFHLFPSRNPTINQAVAPGQEAKFDAYFVPERIPFEIRDDLHPRMRAVLLVVDHPFAAVTDDSGAFEIADLPAGKYSLRVWHERAGFLDKQLTVDIKQGETTKTTLSYTSDRFER